MKDKLSLQKNYKIKQDSWIDTPCRLCSGSPCCTVVPLSPLKLVDRTDFINLALLSCYDNIRLGLKKSGEWSVYYSQNCRFLSMDTSKCLIHAHKTQSLICKSYDAFKCWYKPAFKNNENEKLIFFDLSRLLLFEEATGILKYGFIKNEYTWDELIDLYKDYPIEIEVKNENRPRYFYDNALPFRQCSAQDFLFFPPYERPKKNIHFELILFRLGFPGINLAVADNCWAYILNAQLNMNKLEKIKSCYFPSISPDNSCYSFNTLKKERWVHSSVGEKFIIARFEHIKPLKSITKFDTFGNVRKYPTAKEIFLLLRTINPSKPDKAA